MREDYQFDFLGDRAVVITLGESIDDLTHVKLRRLLLYLSEQRLSGVIDLVPTYTSLTIHYDPCRLRLQQGESPYAHICNRLKKQIAQMERLPAAQAEQGLQRKVTIPVCYEEPFAPDLRFVAEYHQMSVDDVIRIHNEEEYTVGMIGFMPGFPYLSGMSEHIATPRKDRPRPQVDAGSVGIAGLQTGIYPFASPGGWQIIGRTPITLFDSSDPSPSLLSFGDRVKFEPITREQFEAWGK